MSHALHFVDFNAHFFLLLFLFVLSARELSAAGAILGCWRAIREKWIFIKPFVHSFVCCCAFRVWCTRDHYFIISSPTVDSAFFSARTHTPKPKRPLKTIYPLFHRFVYASVGVFSSVITTQFCCNFFFVLCSVGGWLHCGAYASSMMHCIVYQVFLLVSSCICASGELQRSSVVRTHAVKVIVSALACYCVYHFFFFFFGLSFVLPLLCAFNFLFVCFGGGFCVCTYLMHAHSSEQCANIRYAAKAERAGAGIFG